MSEPAVEVGGMSGPALAHAIQDGTRDIWENMEWMAHQAGVPLGGAPPQPRSSCPTTTGQAHVEVACIWCYLSCPTPSMVVPELYTPSIMEPRVLAW
jgi:hypothetical protein